MTTAAFRSSPVLNGFCFGLDIGLVGLNFESGGVLRGPGDLRAVTTGYETFFVCFVLRVLSYYGACATFLEDDLSFNGLRV